MKESVSRIKKKSEYMIENTINYVSAYNKKALDVFSVKWIFHLCEFIGMSIASMHAMDILEHFFWKYLKDSSGQLSITIKDFSVWALSWFLLIHLLYYTMMSGWIFYKAYQREKGSVSERVKKAFFQTYKDIALYWIEFLCGLILFFTMEGSVLGCFIIILLYAISLLYSCYRLYCGFIALIRSLSDKSYGEEYKKEHTISSTMTIIGRLLVILLLLVLIFGMLSRVSIYINILPPPIDNTLATNVLG
ncbi:hypothetical protein NEOKW01_1030 [Nematocida sp. AWRm80]|nr:hypothetical protein NEOKW01_1030 [Nematocida sp. AWRm80]